MHQCEFLDHFYRRRPAPGRRRREPAPGLAVRELIGPGAAGAGEAQATAEAVCPTGCRNANPPLSVSSNPAACAYSFYVSTKTVVIRNVGRKLVHKWMLSEARHFEEDAERVL